MRRPAPWRQMWHCLRPLVYGWAIIAIILLLIFWRHQRGYLPAPEAVLQSAEMQWVIIIASIILGAIGCIRIARTAGAGARRMAQPLPRSAPALVGGAGIILLSVGVAASVSAAGIELRSEIAAAWFQAIFGVLGIVVAIWVPWRIHHREQAAIEKSRNAYKEILRDALKEMREPITHLTAVSDFHEELPDGESDASRATAEALTQLIVKLKEAAAVLDELDVTKRLDQFGAVRSIFDFRRKVREYMPIFEREHGIVTDHPTGPVVSIALEKLGPRAWELRELIDAALDATAKSLAS